MPKKVLVVDDEVHIIHVVGIKLRNNGFEVISASDGSSGYELALAEHPDIIVTDFQMPGLTGLELIGKLRCEEATKQTPVIMLTARSFDVDEEQRRELAISEFLSKPFSPKELLRTVEDILHRQQVMQTQ